LVLGIHQGGVGGLADAHRLAAPSFASSTRNGAIKLAPASSANIAPRRRILRDGMRVRPCLSAKAASPGRLPPK
jgi:hypothetical protein